MVADDPESFADLDGHCGYTAGDYQECGTDNPASCTQDCKREGQQEQPSDGNQQQEAKGAQNQDQSQSQQNQQPNQDKKQDQEKESSGNGGGQARGGERGKTSKPDNKWKHTRPSKDHPGQYEVQDHQTGKWVLKPKGWSPAASSSIASTVGDFVHAHPVASGVAAGVLAVGIVAVIVFSGGTAGPALGAAAAAL
jgi:hypothetical protein